MDERGLKEGMDMVGERGSCKNDLRLCFTEFYLSPIGLIVLISFGILLNVVAATCRKDIRRIFKRNNNSVTSVFDDEL